MEHAGEVDVQRLQADPNYRHELAQILLRRCGKDADHVELRRAAMQTFPQMAKAHSDHTYLAVIVGQAATIRVQQVQLQDRDVTDERLEMTATEPLPYPGLYAEVDDGMRASLIAFCERELEAGREGPEALANLIRRHGWPYSERTFYVGPWKAARLRRRRMNRDDD